MSNLINVYLVTYVMIFYKFIYGYFDFESRLGVGGGSEGLIYKGEKKDRMINLTYWETN